MGSSCQGRAVRSGGAADLNLRGEVADLARGGPGEEREAVLGEVEGGDVGAQQRLLGVAREVRTPPESGELGVDRAPRAVGP